MKTIILIVGTRPNFMKAIPVFNELKKKHKYNLHIIHTGQHWDKNMSDIFIQQLNMPNDMIMLNDTTRHDNGSTYSQNTQLAKMMIGLEHQFNILKPNLVIVFGDVTSTLAGALTANKMDIKLAHVESGNRCFDTNMPEEINRIIVDKISDYLFVAEPYGLDNLQKENITKNDILDQNVFYVGNTMIDTLYTLLDIARHHDTYLELGLKKRDYILLTLHRQLNVDDIAILNKILSELKYINMQFVFPIHPRQKSKIYELVNTLDITNIMLLEPQGYLEFVNLMINSQIVITDSGGVQEETTALGVPCITLRPSTERPITITHGTNTLIKHFSELRPGIEKILNHGIQKVNHIKFWDGRASERIANILDNLLF